MIPELSSFCPCLHRDRSWGCYRYLLAASRWEDAWKRLNTPRGNRASRDRLTPCHSTRLCGAQQSSFQFAKSSVITHSRVEWLSLGSFSRNEFLMRSTPPCALLFFQFLNKANILSWENSAKWKQKWNLKLFSACASSIDNYHMQRLSLSQGFVHDTRLSDRSSEDAICAKSRISSQGSLAIYCSMLSIRQISNVYGLSFHSIARQNVT